MDDESIQMLRSQVRGIGANLSAVIERSKQTERDNRKLRERLVYLQHLNKKKKNKVNVTSDTNGKSTNRSATATAAGVLEVDQGDTSNNPNTPSINTNNEIDKNSNAGNTVGSSDTEQAQAQAAPSQQESQSDFRSTTTMKIGENNNSGSNNEERLLSSSEIPQSQSPSVPPSQSSLVVASKIKHIGMQTDSMILSLPLLSTAIPPAPSGSEISGGAMQQAPTTTSSNCNRHEINLGVNYRPSSPMRFRRRNRMSRVPLTLHGAHHSKGLADAVALDKQPEGGVDEKSMQLLFDTGAFPTLGHAVRRRSGTQLKSPTMPRVHRRIPVMPSDNGRGLGFFLGDHITHCMRD